MPNRIEKLTREILKLCNGQEFGCVLMALHGANDEVLERIADEPLRDAFLLTQIGMGVFAARDDDSSTDALRQVLSAIANIRNREERTKIILGHIKALADAAFNSEDDVDMEKEFRKIAIVHMPYKARRK